MKNLFYKLIAKVTHKNCDATPKEVIVEQMQEPRPLPLGRKEFTEWSDRIIAGAMLKCGSDESMEDFIESQKFALADMIMHLGPAESHKPDAHFIHYLRKVACNQVAHTMKVELQKELKAKVAAKEAAKAALEEDSEE